MDEIDRIEVARVSNNKNWMAILRIAMEADPVGTKKVMREILRRDREISKLMADMVDAQK